MILENLSPENLSGPGDERHMSSVTKQETLRLWRLLATGDIEVVLREQWIAGYGS